MYKEYQVTRYTDECRLNLSKSYFKLFSVTKDLCILPVYKPAEFRLQMRSGLSSNISSIVI